MNVSAVQSNIRMSRLHAADRWFMRVGLDVYAGSSRTTVTPQDHKSRAKVSWLVGSGIGEWWLIFNDPALYKGRSDRALPF
jgi:hypothetical protein